jgi:NAD-dependent dihydropyrimidine dehydrogenase PreA subunit
MKRKIITIDETKCTGCGQCIPDCPEGALQLIDGKARLVSDLFCDGLGACIGTCPEGAISVIEREAAPYDEKAVMATIVKQGQPVIKAHLEHLAGHGRCHCMTRQSSTLSRTVSRFPIIPLLPGTVAGNPPGRAQ